MVKAAIFDPEFWAALLDDNRTRHSSTRWGARGRTARRMDGAMIMKSSEGHEGGGNNDGAVGGDGAVGDAGAGGVIHIHGVGVEPGGINEGDRTALPYGDGLGTETIGASNDQGNRGGRGRGRGGRIAIDHGVLGSCERTSHG